MFYNTTYRPRVFYRVLSCFWTEEHYFFQLEHLSGGIVPWFLGGLRPTSKVMFKCRLSSEHTASALYGAFFMATEASDVDDLVDVCIIGGATTRPPREETK